MFEYGKMTRAEAVAAMGAAREAEAVAVRDAATVAARRPVSVFVGNAVAAVPSGPWTVTGDTLSAPRRDVALDALTVAIDAASTRVVDAPSRGERDAARAERSALRVVYGAVDSGIGVSAVDAADSLSLSIGLDVESVKAQRHAAKQLSARIRALPVVALPDGLTAMDRLNLNDSALARKARSNVRRFDTLADKGIPRVPSTVDALDVVDVADTEARLERGAAPSPVKGGRTPVARWRSIGSQEDGSGASRAVMALYRPVAERQGDPFVTITDATVSWSNDDAPATEWLRNPRDVWESFDHYGRAIAREAFNREHRAMPPEGTMFGDAITVDDAAPIAVSASIALVDALVSAPETVDGARFKGMVACSPVYVIGKDKAGKDETVGWDTLHAFDIVREQRCGNRDVCDYCDARPNALPSTVGDCIRPVYVAERLTVRDVVGIASRRAVRACVRKSMPSVEIDDTIRDARKDVAPHVAMRERHGDEVAATIDAMVHLAERVDAPLTEGFGYRLTRTGADILATLRGKPLTDKGRRMALASARGASEYVPRPVVETEAVAVDRSRHNVGGRA